MGKDQTARTQRDIAVLRGAIEDDLEALTERVRSDLDPRNLVRRQPLAVFGTLGSAAALGGAAIATRVRDSRRKRPDTEIDRIIEDLGGRIDRLKGRARQRFRAQLREELSELDKPKRGAQEAAWAVGMSALTSVATELARRFAGMAARDD